MIRKLLTLILVSTFVVSAAHEVDAGPYDWSLSYTLKVANPQRKILEIEAKYTFPAKTDEVTFKLDDFDSHYTEGYRKHIRTFTLTDSKGNEVELIKDADGVYRASGLRGTYTGHYNIVMDHYENQSRLGIEDTPLFWGTAAIFPGASVIVYPRDVAGSRIGSIEVKFEKAGEQTFFAPYEKIGENDYKVENLNLLKSEFWVIGAFYKHVYQHNGDSVICAITKEGVRFTPEAIESRIDSVLNFYVSIFGELPEHLITMSVFYTPTSSKRPGFHSFGAVGNRSFNCLIDEKVTDQDLNSQVGLLAYNLMSFWTPGHFRPSNTAQLDWFTTGVLNYSQLKTMLRLGCITNDEYFDRLGGTYTAYREQLARRGLSMQTLLSIANSKDQTVYGFMLCAMLDFCLIDESHGAASMDDVLTSLYHTYGDTRGYSIEDLYELFRQLGLKDVDSLMQRHFKETDPIDLNALLRDYGFVSTYSASGGLDIGMELTGENDLHVNWVDPNGPAKAAGIEPGDILTVVRGFKLQKESDLPKILSTLGAGDEFDVTVDRNGKERKFEVTLTRKMVYKITPIMPIPPSAQELWHKYRSI